MDDKRAELFDEYYAAVFKDANIFSQEEYDRNAAAFRALYGRWMPADRDAAILDIGCGTGQFLYYVKSGGYTNFEGIDLSESQLEFCRKTFTDKVTRAEAFDFLSDKSDRYDLMALNDVIEHVPKDRVVALLKRIRASLKPGGRLILKCPNMGNPMAVYLRYKDFTHEAGYADRSLYQVLYLAGFRTIDIRPSPSPITFGGPFIARLLTGLYYYALSRLYWWQGMVAPRVMSGLLVATAQK